MDEKLRLWPYFLLVFDHFFKNDISGQKWTKSYIALFLLVFAQKMWAKNGRKVKAIALLFARFCPLFQK